MKIPKSIKIGSNKYKVRVVNNLPDRMAELEVASCVINIAKTCSENKYYISEHNQAEGLLHEILHAISINNGYGISEKIVTCFANNLLSIIRANKLNFLDTTDVRDKKGKK